MSDSGRILIVDDNKINRMTLSRALADQGHDSATAENGREALERLAAEAFDVILLDILMPEMDGYETLQRLKQDADLRHLPVIVISAVDEMESVLRCIEMGAADYLPKPFNAPLLRARINASLANKRLRDLEIEYLEQVNYVMEAAGAVEAGSFEVGSLDPVADRGDALGQLARVFQRMAREVYQREQRLRKQVEDLRIEIDEARQNKKVAEITETDYFRALSSQADALRGIMNGNNTDEPDE
jgi:CheY-like chemotaxis protein